MVCFSKAVLISYHGLQLAVECSVCSGEWSFHPSSSWDLNPWISGPPSKLVWLLQTTQPHSQWLFHQIVHPLVYNNFFENVNFCRKAEFFLLAGKPRRPSPVNFFFETLFGGTRPSFICFNFDQKVNRVFINLLFLCNYFRHLDK